LTGPSDGRPGGSEKRESLVSLRERYIEARAFVPSDEPYANLRWILGLAGSPTHDPLSLDSRTVDVVALWMQDLAREIERQPDAFADDHQPDLSRSSVLSPDRRGIARSLREATQRFLAAFGHLPRAAEAAAPPAGA
jgi:hypothetical protein